MSSIEEVPTASPCDELKTQSVQARLGTPLQLHKLWAPGRPSGFIEMDRKAEAVAFCDEHYQGWREQACERAEPFLSLSAEAARGGRAMWHVEMLGRAWWATGDVKYGQAFERIYTRAATGELFNWGPFAGAQAATELSAHLLLLDCQGYGESGRVAFLDHAFGLTERAWDHYVSRWSQLMLGPEGHNWWIHGIQSLPYIGVLFPELKRAEFFRDAGWSVIQEHVRGNYHRDGGSRERTPGYQAGTVRLVWRLYDFAKRNGLSISSSFEERLLRSTHFLIDAMAPNGAVPAFGDSTANAAELMDLCALAAALSGDGRCKWAAMQAQASNTKDVAAAQGVLPHASFWSVGLDAAAAYEQVVPDSPTKRSICLPDTGIAVLRDGWGVNDCYMAINTGARGPSVTSHGHNDIFSFELYAGGKRLLGHPGGASYSDTPGRNYDLKTKAHNCLTIQDQEQVPIIDQWRWDGCVLPRIRRWDTAQDIELFHAVHDGFCRGDRRMLHERKVTFVRPRKSAGVSPYWIIMDRVESDASQPCEAWFHGCVPAESNGLDIVFSDSQSDSLLLRPPKNDQLTLVRDEGEGFQAYCRELNIDPQSYPAFAYCAEAAAHVFVWLLMPLTADAHRPTIERVPATLNGADAVDHDATAVRVDHGNVVDELVICHRPYDAEIGMQGRPPAWGQSMFHRSNEAGDTLSQELRSTLDGSDTAMP